MTTYAEPPVTTTGLSLVERARLMGALMRVAYPVSVAMAGVLPRTPLAAERDAVTIHLPPDLAPLGSERLMGRLRQLGRLVGLEPRVRVAPEVASSTKRIPA